MSVNRNSLSGGTAPYSNSENPSKTPLAATISKALSSQSAWPDKEEFLDVIYWLRQIVGVLLGLIWGVIAIQGLVGIVLFAAINAGLLYLYFSGYQSVDEEEYGGVWELTKEGFVTSFASFLVMWIIVYTGLHFD
jgi:hypothetical protein